MKTGLVLEGGAMRGMYTAGVMDIMMDHDIHFDGIIGVSAGALFGVNYLSRQRGRVIRYNKKYNGRKDYMGILPLLKEGNIVSTRLAYDRVPRLFDVFDNDTFKASETEFYAVVTNLQNGQPEYMRVKDVYEQMDVLRASGSMPFVSKPVQIDGQYYLDGGVSDSIPFDFFEKQGYDRLVVVLTRDLDYRKKAMSPLMIEASYHKYPDFCEQLKIRHEVYNRSVRMLKRQEEQGEIFVIRPSLPITIRRIESDPEKLQMVYEQGLKDATDSMEQLQAYLQDSFGKNV